MIVAGVAVAVVVAAGAAWQFGGFNRAPVAAPAAQIAPPQAAPVVATPDVGPSIANVASVPQWGKAASVPSR